ncbi:MAG: histidine kinase dimerization/phosphoacceptor domain-containing protein [Acidimicrobiales bacterium]
MLAHRISLVALHAGALEVARDLPPEQVRESAGLLRSTAHQALEELRDVIGVLREEPGRGRRRPCRSRRWPTSPPGGGDPPLRRQGRSRAWRWTSRPPPPGRSAETPTASCRRRSPT